MTLLEACGLSKDFGGLRAVHEVDLTVREGEILGLIGPNGAGKSTCVDLLTGFRRPDAGRVVLGGREITGQPAYGLAALGMARTFQQLHLFPSLTPLEAVRSGGYRHARDGFWWRLSHPRAAVAVDVAARARAAALLESVGVDPGYAGRSGDLPYGVQKRIGLAIALATAPVLLFLDEPAAGLNPAEKGTLYGMLRRLAAGGVTLVVIDHDMRFVMSLCNRVAVLDHGRKIADGRPADVTAAPDVIAAYLGASEADAGGPAEEGPVR